MIARCTNPNHPSWKDYGGRGIKVCERWLVFKNFYDDMFSSYRAGLTIDRENNSLGYFKENCRWIPGDEQPLNTRATRKVTVGGVTLAAKQWSRVTGVSYQTLLHRLNKGWPHEKAVQP
jgi:hypothetical protein